LTTAAELAEAERADDVARCVYAQALEAAGPDLPRRLNPWRRGRATAAAAVLAALTAGVTALLPTLGLPKGTDEIAALARELDSMNPAERSRLKEAARQAAAAGGAEELTEKALAAIEARDAAQFEQIVRKLKAAGFDVMRELPPGMKAKVARAMAGQGGGAATRTVRGDDRRPTTGPTAEPGKHGPVRVMHPQYAELVKASAEPSPADAAGTIDFESAWDLARARAAERLAAGRVPPEHRQTVRRFFAERPRQAGR
jgi:hypothetical protein